MGTSTLPRSSSPDAVHRTDTIPVTYVPSLEKLAPTLQAALDAWDKVDCAGICFMPIISAPTGPVNDLDLRLHFADNGSGSGTAWELLNDGRTGRTLHATLYATKVSTIGDLMKQVGFALGFEGVKGKFRDTVIEEPLYPSPRTVLGAIDRQSVCAVYPSCR